MNRIRRYWLSLLLVALSCGAPIVVYDQLPAQLPIHWGLDGEINGWMAKPWGAFLTPLTSAVVVALCVLVPSMSPSGYSMDRFQRIYPTLVAAVAGLLLSVTLLLLMAALGTRIAIARHVLSLLGVLFLVIGNYLGKLTRNFFVGIRTPWTLASDIVWERTHRLAAPLFVIGGLCHLNDHLCRPLAMGIQRCGRLQILRTQHAA
jgi:uncharacterized membrane protein